MKRTLFFIVLLLAIQVKAQNYSVGLNGTNQAVNIGTGAAITGTGGFTLEMWVKTTSASPMLLLGQRDGSGSGYIGSYSLGVNAGKVAWFTYENGSNGFNIVSSNASVNDGNWHHIAATRENDGSGRIYIDGILDFSVAGTAAPLAPLPVAIGYDYRQFSLSSPAEFFNGSIEEVRIWNVTRTQAEIKQTMFRSPAINAAGLVAYYNCNENGGSNLINSCTNTAGIDGTIIGGPVIWSQSPVQFGSNAINFDGVDDVIPTTGSINGLSAFTIEGWIYPTTAAAGIGFFGQNDAFEFGFTSATSIGGWTGNAVPSGANSINWTFTPVTFPLNTWHHVAFTGDGTFTHLYIDGVEVASVANAASPYGSSGYLFSIGGNVWDPAPSGFFPGSIDEVRVWNVARTQSQVQSAMNVELNPATQTGLIAYYTFNQGIADLTNTGLLTVPDMAGNNKGTLTNFLGTGTSSNYVAQKSSLFSLPLNWISFTGQRQSDNILLKWTTSMEQQTKDFVVEHSVNGTKWEQVGSVKANNNGAVTNNYQYVHSSPVNGENYYRLIQRDLDGHFAYSKTISVQFNASRPVIYPNPVANGILTVQLKQPGNMMLYNNNGQLVMTKLLTAGSHQIDVKQLAKGMYSMRINEERVAVVIQ